jgi:hypothetical protein
MKMDALWKTLANRYSSLVNLFRLLCWLTDTDHLVFGVRVDASKAAGTDGVFFSGSLPVAHIAVSGG